MRNEVAPTVSEVTRSTVVNWVHALTDGDDHGGYLDELVTHTVMETGEVTHGRQNVVRLTAHLFREAFTTSIEVRRIMVDGQHACVEALYVGTHVGEFAGIVPTGRTVHVPFAMACDVVGNHVTALRVYLPLDALVHQVRTGPTNHVCHQDVV